MGRSTKRTVVELAVEAAVAFERVVAQKDGIDIILGAVELG